MGLLMSDTVLIDPMLDDTAWMRDTVSDWAYAMEADRDAYEYEAAGPTE